VRRCAVSTADSPVSCCAPGFLDTDFCLDALEATLERQRGPTIFNTDQGCQFTSEALTDRLKMAQVAISMDGRGRVIDNIFVERLSRSLTYECMYLHEFAEVPALLEGLANYFDYFNFCQLNQRLAESDTGRGLRRRLAAPDGYDRSGSLLLQAANLSS